MRPPIQPSGCVHVHASCVCVCVSGGAQRIARGVPFSRCPLCVCACARAGSSCRVSQSHVVSDQFMTDVIEQISCKSAQISRNFLRLRAPPNFEKNFAKLWPPPSEGTSPQFEGFFDANFARP